MLRYRHGQESGCVRDRVRQRHGVPGPGRSRSSALCLVALVLLLSLPAAWAYKGRHSGGYTIPTISVLSSGLGSEDEIAIHERYPDGAGPFPAVVVFHGCAGLRIPRYSGWTNWFHARGYAVFFVDSWGPRGIYRDCPAAPGSRAAAKPRSRWMHMALRIGDAWAAVRHVARLPRIRSDAIVAFGFSHGGNVVFRSATSGSIYDDLGNTGPRYAAGIALYGSCLPFEGFPKPQAPLLIIAGSEDPITRMRSCHRAKKARYPDDDSIQVHTIQGAHHGFDRPVIPGRRRWWKVDGFLRIEPNRKATEEARALIDRFLTEFVEE